MVQTRRTAEMTSRRVLIVPRWGAKRQDDWYPWLQAQLAGSNTFAPLVVGDMPDPDEPAIAAWRARIAKLAGSDAVTLADTVLVGHSVGCQAVLHFLAGLPGLDRRRRDPLRGGLVVGR